jgi:hypothetical protein
VNKLIQELAQETHLIDTIREHHTEFGHGDVDYSDLDDFAELIVQECIECTKEWYEARIADSARDYSRGYVHGCDEAIAEMKKRFGVEE